jgi:glycosyltransferase involved in cell wall biosynthesis
MEQLVSILIPAYNAEYWIIDTIKSALDQTWSKKEIIVVDDGSSDNTLEISKTLASKTVQVVTQPNAGACGARNKAFSLAQGDYIQWLDADDLLAPDKISQQMKACDDGQTSRVLISSAFGTFFVRHQKANFKPNSLWYDLAPVDWIFRKFTENIWLNPAVWLVSRKLTDMAGPWDMRLSLDDDGEYFTRVVSLAEEIKFIREGNVYYRIGNLGSLSSRTSREACESLFLSLTLCINYLLSLENSTRTRAACVTYLQSWLPLFYPEQEDIVNRTKNLAHQLGGDLLVPDLSWKYYPIQKIFGWKATKKVMHEWKRFKLMSSKNLDRLLHSLGDCGGTIHVF